MVATDKSAIGALVIDGMSGEDLLRYLEEHQPSIWQQLIGGTSQHSITLTTDARVGPRLFTRSDALRILKIGETTLFWLQRTGKLKVIRIGSRVLFPASEIHRLAAHGASLTEVEKQAAAQRDTKATGHRHGRPRKSATERREAAT